MAYKVQVQPSGHTFICEAGESVLDAALRQGIGLSYGCRSGGCGACKGKVVAGQVDLGEVSPQALSEQEQAVGMALLCQARPDSDLVIEVAEALAGTAIEPRKLSAKVAKKELLADDVVRLMLRLPNNVRLPFFAGQYIDFLLPDGRRRSFSLANAPHDDEFLELHIRHVQAGEFTEYVLHDMKEKDIVRIIGPMGDFYLREDSPRPLLFVAGGTGFAPIKGIIEHALAAGIPRSMHLYWGARAKADLYLDELPRRWGLNHAHFRYTPVLSAPRPEDRWSGRCGLVHEAVLADHPDLSGYDIYAGGPPAMVQAMHQAAMARNFPAEQFFSDPFEFAPDTLAKQRAQMEKRAQ